LAGFFQAFGFFQARVSAKNEKPGNLPGFVAGKGLIVQLPNL
jgi:hypothetical protein